MTNTLNIDLKWILYAMEKREIQKYALHVKKWQNM